MAYATQSDLTDAGIPAAALGTGQTAVTTTQITKALQEASDFADGFFRARYGMTAVPFVAWDSTVTKQIAKIAAYYVMGVRGYFSQGDVNEEIRRGYTDAVEWLNKVQRQQAHPLVTLANSATARQEPNLISSSVVNLSSGGSSNNRGW